MSNQVTDSELYYRVFGNGHPVVFLHGFLESSTMWDNFHFDGIQCIHIDLPGHGMSISKHTDFSMKSMAQKVQNILLKLEVKKFSIIGHSMGGYVALELLKLNRNFDKLILLNSNFWNDSPAKVKDRIRVAEVVKEKKEFFIYEVIPNLFYQPEKYDLEVKGMIADALNISQMTIAKTSIAMSERENNSIVLKKNLAKVYILQGEKDTVVPLKNMKKELNGIAANYFQLPTGHMSHIELKKETNQLLLQIIKA